MIKSAYVFAIQRTPSTMETVQEASQQRFNELFVSWQRNSQLHAIQLPLVVSWIDRHTVALAQLLGVNQQPPEV